MSKELYFETMVELASKYEDQGMSPDEAYERAGNEAYGVMRSRLLDMADMMRKRERGE